MTSEPDTIAGQRPLETQGEYPSLSLPHCLVIIPAHNESQDIAFVIGEVQKYSNFPVVVIDDASTDTPFPRLVPPEQQWSRWPFNSVPGARRKPVCDMH